MNGWRSRLMVLAVLLLAPWLHSQVMADVPNTDEGMALFHAGAAAVDYLILCCAPRFISGRLCDDTQTLCIVSVIANCVGFYAYTAYASPIYYNTFMWGLSYVQWARLLLVGRHADFSGYGLVPGAGRGWGPENIGKAYS